jgi:hypothetical protein
MPFRQLNTLSVVPRQENYIDELENQVNSQHSKSDYQRKVWDRTDIWMPTKDCSDVLLSHGFTWTSWIHFAVHRQTFEFEHEAAWVSPIFVDGDSLWLATYFGFIAVRKISPLRARQEADGSKMSLMFMDEDEAKGAGLPRGLILHSSHSNSIPVNLTHLRKYVRACTKLVRCCTILPQRSGFHAKSRLQDGTSHCNTSWAG